MFSRGRSFILKLVEASFILNNIFFLIFTIWRVLIMLTITDSISHLLKKYAKSLLVTHIAALKISGILHLLFEIWRIGILKRSTLRSNLLFMNFIHLMFMSSLILRFTQKRMKMRSVWRNVRAVVIHFIMIVATMWLSYTVKDQMMETIILCIIFLL